uniref:Uncharacterized protein n=1 Tax=Anguilla anguilla TaxID=7936 RepID=A0A0E9WZD1_ANGAN
MCRQGVELWLSRGGHCYTHFWGLTITLKSQHFASSAHACLQLTPTAILPAIPITKSVPRHW